MVLEGLSAKGFEMRRDLTNYEADLCRDLADPEYASLYVSSALEDDATPEEFLLALRDVADARQMTKVAEDAKLNRVSLYKMLRGSGNPHLHTLRALLKALGLRLSVVVAVSGENDKGQHPVPDSDLTSPTPLWKKGLDTDGLLSFLGVGNNADHVVPAWLMTNPAKPAWDTRLQLAEIMNAGSTELQKAVAEAMHRRLEATKSGDLANVGLGASPTAEPKVVSIDSKRKTIRSPKKRRSALARAAIA
jgi:probable addiction module antidote protein